MRNGEKQVIEILKCVHFKMMNLNIKTNISEIFKKE